MSVPSSFDDAVFAIVQSFREKIKGGLAWPEFLALLTQLVSALMVAAQHLAQAGDQKKQLVLDTVGKTFDIVAPLVPLPGPVWLVAFLEPIRPMIRPIVKAIVLRSADGILEGLFRINFKPAPLA